MADTKMQGVIELRENISESIKKAKSVTEAFTQTAKTLKKELEGLEKNRKALIDAGATTKEMQKIDSKLGTLKRELKQPTKMKVDADTSKAKSEVDKLKGFISRAVAGVAIGAGVVAAFKTGIEYNASMEQSAISWNTILRDEQAAAVTMKQLVDMAAKTPFQFKELDGVAKKLQMAGFSGDSLFTALTNVGDAVSAIGGDSEVLNGIATAFYQIYTKGKLSAEEMLQLGERGIPAWEILAEKMGMGADELQELTSKGKVLANDVLPLLSEGLGERFGGSMEAQSQTLKGMLTTTKDLGSQLLSIGTEGAFDALKGGLEGVNRELESDAAKKFARDVGGVIGKTVQGFVDFGKAAWKAKEAIAVAGAAFGAYFLGSKIAGGIETVVGGVKALTGGLKAAKTAQDGLNTASLASGWGLIAAAIGAAVAGLTIYYNKSREHLEEFKNQSDEIVSAFEDLKKSAESGKIKLETDFSSTKQEIDEIKTMIENGEWGEGLDRKIGFLLEKCPELGEAIVKSGDKWELHTEKLDNIFEKMMRNAEYAYYQGEVDKATEQINTYESEDAQKKRDDRQAEIDRLRDAQEINPLFQFGMGKMQMDDEINKLEKAKDEEWAAYVEAAKRRDAIREKLDVLEAPEPVTEPEQTPEQATDTRIVGEIQTRNDDILTRYLAEQRTMNSYQENLDKGTAEGLAQVARALSLEREKYDDGRYKESESDFRGRVGKELDDKRLELDKGFITELEGSIQQGITDGGNDMSTALKTTLADAANGIAGSIDNSLSLFRSGFNVRLIVSADGSFRVENTGGTSKNRSQSHFFAEGTNYAPGGRAIVGEQGPEIVDLPKGSKVTPAHITSQQLAKGGGGINVTIQMGGVVVREEADIDRIAAALVRKLEVAALMG